MQIRQLLDPTSSTWTYLMWDPATKEALLLDSVREQVDRDLRIVEELGLRLVVALETHVHADHITGGGLLRARTGCALVVPEAGGVHGADRAVGRGDAVRFGYQALEVRPTPGHTSGCTSYVTVDRARVFTGDTLLIRGCGRTDFQEGDPRLLFASVRDQLFSLPDDTLVQPAHDYQGRTASTIREERLYNPRLGAGKDEAAFVAIMEGLQLAPPAKIAVAVPANRRCGLLDGEDGAWSPPAGFRPLRSPSGAPVVSPAEYAAWRGRVHVVDIREVEEHEGPLGTLAEAERLPMREVPARAATWDKAAPLVLVCRSGGRSDRLALELESQGFRAVASLTGGMLAWHAAGLPLGGEDRVAEG